MRKRIFLSLILSFTLISCTSNDEDIQNVVENKDIMPTKIFKPIMGPDENDPFKSNSDLYYFYDELLTYNNGGNLIKVERSYKPDLFPVYLDLNRNGNTVTVEYKSNDSDGFKLKNTVIYTLNNIGKAVEKYIPVVGPNSFAVRKYYYEYSADGRLYKIKLKYPNYTSNSHLDELERIDVFIYSGNNLKKIISQSVKEYDTNSNSRTEIDFLDYDNARNPFKRLGLLESYFYRSLSENNYRQINYTSFDANNNVIGFSEQKWDFFYDQNNNLILSYD
ncbi:hypothetical protein [Chryseobacterium sp. ERMR1:04]|uniref:hypothetical protein n=1 Tax=Chryseobacterium sp. ERMR1:04 TaxID=1705393 RepID=UPI0006CE012C|nr:hypothetical protein [Chryseobacterium sp. ERMR1:04]KPH13108.1 hypothetical protein AMQ68_11505 [Chryseobacterium sp. ERMR1:04]